MQIVELIEPVRASRCAVSAQMRRGAWRVDAMRAATHDAREPLHAGSSIALIEVDLAACRQQFAHQASQTERAGQALGRYSGGVVLANEYLTHCPTC